MSANPLPSKVNLSPELSTVERQIVVQALELLPFDVFDNLQAYGDSNSDKPDDSLMTIKKIVDGRGLACPMPLLKTKVALREVALGESLYVLATDPNSQADIMAFCKQSHSKARATNNIIDYSLALIINQTSANVTTDTKNLGAIDTIFHFIITKTDSN